MTNRKYKMYYDYRKRISGGFLDAIFLSGIMLSGLILILLSIAGGIHG